VRKTFTPAIDLAFFQLINFFIKNILSQLSLAQLHILRRERAASNTIESIEKVA